MNDAVEELCMWLCLSVLAIVLIADWIYQRRKRHERR